MLLATPKVKPLTRLNRRAELKFSEDGLLLMILGACYGGNFGISVSCAGLKHTSPRQGSSQPKVPWVEAVCLTLVCQSLSSSCIHNVGINRSDGLPCHYLEAEVGIERKLQMCRLV
jgi:hypothetical protein